MGHRRPSTTATIVGPSAVSGSAFSRKWRPPVQFLTSFPSPAATSRRTARRLVQKGGVRGSDWLFARRKNEQNPCFGRSRQTGRLCADAGKRRRHHHGRSIAWSCRQTKAAAGRQSLRRRQPAQMAQTKEGQSRRSIHSLTPDALSSGQQGLQTQKSHRTHVLQLKNWRRIATRYDRYAQNYLSGLALAAIMIAWI